ncbi:MAG: D-alanyl-D-alanine endopeptidase [Gammaproteobacteria bacterium]|nr:D-alanyl-D-alanine endopeptidase [Gammaproteobacteria bacterium]
MQTKKLSKKLSSLLLMVLVALSLPVLALDDESYITADELRLHLDPGKLHLRSSAAVIYDLRDGQVLFERNADAQRPVASLTKLMTAMVVLDAGLPLDEELIVTRADRDTLRGSRSRLAFGTRLTREDMLLISLVASENRAAAALGRNYPGGIKGFVAAMNQKAKQLGMMHTRFADATGLDDDNVSTARDLVKMVEASQRYPLIREASVTAKSHVTDLRSNWKIEFINTNRLVRQKTWDVEVSKTGYIVPAGHCLVMSAMIADRPVAVVLLNSWGKQSKFGDASRIKNWLLSTEKRVARAHGTLASAG